MRRLDATYLAAGLVLAAVAAVVALRYLGTDTEPPAPLDPADYIGGPFTLVDQTGATVTDADFLGKYLLIYFGFTHCPDVCPTTLAEVATVVDEVGDERLQPLFITVDPQRDTPEALAEYVTYFHPRLIGLTGTDEQVKQVEDAYQVQVFFTPSEDDPDGYEVNHTSVLYLMGPDGRLLERFSHGAPAEQIAEGIRAHL